MLGDDEVDLGALGARPRVLGDDHSGNDGVLVLDSLDLADLAVGRNDKLLGRDPSSWRLWLG
jgi:hypothetical protein